MSKSALLLASIIVYVTLNANELCWLRPSLPWGDEQTVDFSRETG